MQKITSASVIIRTLRSNIGMLVVLNDLGTVELADNHLDIIKIGNANCMCGPCSTLHILINDSVTCSDASDDPCTENSLKSIESSEPSFSEGVLNNDPNLNDDSKMINSTSDKVE